MAGVCIWEGPEVFTWLGQDAELLKNSRFIVCHVYVLCACLLVKTQHLPQSRLILANKYIYICTLCVYT